MTPRQRIETLLAGGEPDSIIYSPNIWQWFNHHKAHGTLPSQLEHCESLLDAHLVMGEDCFSRNLAADNVEEWYGGFTKPRFDNTVSCLIIRDGHKKSLEYATHAGTLTEEFFFEHQSSTLIQRKFLLEGMSPNLEAFKYLVAARHFDFDKNRWDNFESRIGQAGMNICGCWCNPLKLFHFAADPANTVFILMDQPEIAQDIMEIHTEIVLESVKQAIAGGVKVLMTMDNLDTNFYPPPYFEKYCVPFFRRLTDLCHASDVKVFSHACGQVRELLPLCADCGLDGLEGVTPPPLGNVELYEAITLTGNRFICNGGITPLTQKAMKSRQDCFDFTHNVFKHLKNRRAFIYSMSCNTAIDTSYDVVRWFGDAARQISKEIFG